MTILTYSIQSAGKSPVGPSSKRVLLQSHDFNRSGSEFGLSPGFVWPPQPSSSVSALKTSSEDKKNYDLSSHSEHVKSTFKYSAGPDRSVGNSPGRSALDRSFHYSPPRRTLGNNSYRSFQHGELTPSQARASAIDVVSGTVKIARDSIVLGLSSPSKGSPMVPSLKSPKRGAVGANQQPEVSPSSHSSTKLRPAQNWPPAPPFGNDTQVLARPSSFDIDDNYSMSSLSSSGNDALKKKKTGKSANKSAGGTTKISQMSKHSVCGYERPKGWVESPKEENLDDDEIASHGLMSKHSVCGYERPTGWVAKDGTTRETMRKKNRGYVVKREWYPAPDDDDDSNSITPIAEEEKEEEAEEIFTPFESANIYVVDNAVLQEQKQENDDDHDHDLFGKKGTGVCGYERPTGWVMSESSGRNKQSQKGESTKKGYVVKRQWSVDAPSDETKMLEAEKQQIDNATRPKGQKEQEPVDIPHHDVTLSPCTVSSSTSQGTINSGGIRGYGRPEGWVCYSDEVTATTTTNTKKKKMSKSKNGISTCRKISASDDDSNSNSSSNDSKHKKKSDDHLMRRENSVFDRPGNKAKKGKENDRNKNKNNIDDDIDNIDETVFDRITKPTSTKSVQTDDTVSLSSSSSATSGAIRGYQRPEGCVSSDGRMGRFYTVQKKKQQQKQQQQKKKMTKYNDYPIPPPPIL